MIVDIQSPGIPYPVQTVASKSHAGIVTSVANNSNTKKNCVKNVVMTTKKPLCEFHLKGWCQHGSKGLDMVSHRKEMF